MYYGCHPEGWCCIDVHCVRTDRCDVSNEALEMPLQLPRDQATGSCMMFFCGIGVWVTRNSNGCSTTCYIVCSVRVSTWATQQVRWKKDGARATKNWQGGSLWWRDRQSGPLLKMQCRFLGAFFGYVWCLQDLGNCHYTKSESMTLCFDFRWDHQFVPAKA